ncbi:hypothetical protein [Kytococcus sp. Marseille-QA3725]
MTYPTLATMAPAWAWTISPFAASAIALVMWGLLATPALSHHLPSTRSFTTFNDQGQAVATFTLAPRILGGWKAEGLATSQPGEGIAKAAVTHLLETDAAPFATARAHNITVHLTAASKKLANRYEDWWGAWLHRKHPKSRKFTSHPRVGPTVPSD